MAAGFVGLMLTTPPGTAHGPHRDVPARLVFESGLLARLRILAAGLHKEIVLCLTGTLEGGTAVASGFVMPDPVHSDTDGALFGPCPANAVAIWHNHPLAVSAAPSTGASHRRLVGDPGAVPRDLCALSASDIQTAARSRHPFVVVAAGGDTWCWWTLRQVTNLARDKAIRGGPVPGQIESGTRQPEVDSRSYQTP